MSLRAPDEGDQRAERLSRALVALRHAQEAWLDDLRQVCLGDPAVVAAFRRWEERLTLIKLHVHRCEARLLHWLLIPGRVRGEAPAAPGLPERRVLARDWRERLEQWFSAQRIDPAYRRIEDVLDHDQEAVTADIVTDLAQLAELATLAVAALAGVGDDSDQDALEDLAFYRVIGPWRSQGQPALHDVLRWLAEHLRDQEDW